MQYVTMTNDRLYKIATHVMEQLPHISETEVEDFIDGGADGWPDAGEHQIWIDTASDDEIIGWAVAGLR